MLYETPVLEPDAKTIQKKAGRAYNRVGWGVLVFFLLPNLLSFLFQGVIHAIAPEWNGHPYVLWGIQVLAVYLIGTPLAVWVMGKPPADIPAPERKKPHPFLPILSFLLMMTASILGNFISNMLISLWSIFTGHTVENTLNTLIIETPMWLILSVVVVVGPLAEEWVFRRTLMRRLQPYGEVSAILLSGISFGLIHGNFFQFFYATALGLILAYVYARTQNLVYPAVLHILFNFWGSAVPMLWLKRLPLDIAQLTNDEFLVWVKQNMIPFLGMMGYALLNYAMAAAGFILLLIFAKHIRPGAPTVPLPKEGRARTRFWHTGILSALVVTGAMLILSLFA